jgi:ribosome maturation protein SDO1
MHIGFKTMVKGNKLIDDRVQIAINLVRYQTHGKTFEVAINPDLVVKYIEGVAVDMNELLESQHVFSDVKKGLLANETELKTIFQTTEIQKIIPIMIAKGEIQFNQKYRDSLREQKYNQIVYLIHKQAVDPRTGLPHPITRIESALKEAKVKIDDFKKAQDQLDSIVKHLQPIIPLSFQKSKLEIIIPASYSSQVKYACANKGKMIRETWGNDGELVMVIEIASGIKLDLLSTIQSIAKGEALIKELI